MNIESAFLDAIRAAGLDYVGPILADAGIKRFKANGDRAPNSWYVLHTDGVPAGRFGCHKRDIDERWCAVGSESLTEEERAERDRKWEEQRKARQALEAQHAAGAVQRAQTILDAAQPATDDHPYLVTKGAKAYPGLKVGNWPKKHRTLQNCLLIPLRRFDGSLSTLEAIYATIDPETGRDKDLLFQGQKTGAAFVIGDLSASPVILIAEGYATTATLHEATGYAAVMAVDKGNLKPVMRALTALYPDKRRLVCADNDRFTQGNPGVTAARAAARESRALPPAIPEFSANEQGSDFNDLMKLRGMDVVREAIDQALQANIFLRKEKYNQPTGLTVSAESITYQFPSRQEVDRRPSSFEIAVPDLTTDDDYGGSEAVIDSKAAQQLATALNQRLAFCREAAIWHGFIGTHWEPLDNGVADELVTRLLYAGTPDCGFKAHYATAVTSLLRKGLLPLPATAASETRLIPFSNGLLNPETRVLTPITPDNALAWSLPYAFDSQADCPRIKAWLQDAVGDAATVEFLRAWFAALLTGRTDLQKFLHLLGKGQSGKGTFIRLLTALVGAHNTASTDLRRLEQSRFETATLYGKRLAAITDTSRYGGSVDVLKALTGQDRIAMERKHKDAGSFVFEGLIVIASNEPLQFTDYTGAVERRRLTVPFNRAASDAERDLWDTEGGETAILHQEIPGLVNWCLQLSRSEVRQLINNERPEQVVAANLDALRASNPIADWLMENTLPDPESQTQIGVCRQGLDHGREVFENADCWLYANYLTWCKECRREPVSLNRFTGHILDVGHVLNIPIKKDRNAFHRFFRGLRIRQEFEKPHNWNPGKDDGLLSTLSTSCQPQPPQVIDSDNPVNLSTQNKNSFYTGEKSEKLENQEISQSPLASVQSVQSVQSVSPGAVISPEKISVEPADDFSSHRSPTARRIIEALTGVPAGFSLAELSRQVGSDKGITPAIIELALMGLVRAGEVTKGNNGNWMLEVSAYTAKSGEPFDDDLS
ncbi:MAG TPA: phage/plasmid primase, P4 family [Candidatus Competibacteraceae bacterium]|nr:phage/plasmid primase, P4 family [Candidatus Competibacteraceae bacterium]